MKHLQGQWSTKNLQKFWDNVYDTTKEMTSISSTVYFGEREKYFVKKWFGNLKNKKVFKSDLWDEINNTKLLEWMHNRGAQCFGIDISSKVLNAVRKNSKFITAKHADIRDVPFKDNSFDHIISIGTVEHFPDTIRALEEMYRILKPGGVAFIGVPVKYDLWGRFIFIGILQKIGIYKYGYEIQYRRNQFKKLLQEAGFEVIEGRSYLIFPSVLRILDYAFHEKNIKWGNRLIKKILDVFYKIETRSQFISDMGYCVAFKCTKLLV